MAKKQRVSETPATAWLKSKGIAFGEHPYEYEEHGGTEVSARELGVPEHAVIKTLIMHDEQKRPLVVLMHGDCEVSTKNLARQLAVKSIEPCPPAIADKHSGYQVGGTSPFGTRQAMPVYMEASIAELPRIYLNGGKRGYLIGVDPADVVRVLQPTLVNVAVAG